MTVKTEVPNYKEVNVGFVNKVFSGNQEKVAEAAGAITNFVRIYLREQGILRRAIPPVLIGPDEIDRVDWTDNPVKILEFQVDSIAYSVPFRGKAPMREYKGKKAAVEFIEYQTDRFHIQKPRLLTYRHPVQQVITEQGILDLQRAEDETFIEALDKIATDHGKQITISTGGQGLTLDALVEAEKAFHNLRPWNRQIPLATIIVNHITFADLKKLPATVFTPNTNEQLIKGDVEGVQIGGYNWVVTNKIDLVPTNTMYLLTSREYLGGFYLMQDATAYMEVRGIELTWYLYEIAALGIVTDGMLKVTLQ